MVQLDLPNVVRDGSGYVMPELAIVTGASRVPERRVALKVKLVVKPRRKRRKR